jgi:hypothetical protein
MMNVLVVWSEVPDSVDFVLFRNISTELCRKLSSFHGKYIDQDDESETADLNEIFYDEAGKFRFEKHPGPIRGYQWDAVIHTGIIV